MKLKIDRNKETSDKLYAMWDSFSDKARDVISTTDIWVIDDLFGNLETPEEVNRFIDDLFGNLD